MYLKSVIILIASLVTIHSNAFASIRYWVFFSDKGTANTIQLSELRSTWTERSLQRRQRNGVSLDERDAPVNADYIAQIDEIGATVINSSRWLNAVSVDADSILIRNLLSLDCVSNIQQVGSIRRDNICLEDTLIDADNSFIPLGAYGESWRQAEQIGVIDAHRRGLTGSGVLIGILDTGFQLDHRAFAGLDVLAQYDFIFNDNDPSYDPNTDSQSQPSHGTGCLSVIGGYDPGYLVGIAPRATFALAKTELTNLEIPQEEDYWVAGIEWLEWLGADVVNSSLSYSDWYWKSNYDGMTAPTTVAAERACELGMVICNSAGNAGPDDITLGAPADAPNVLTIAAVDAAGFITRFSSRGPSADGRIKPDVAAMGYNVTCVQPNTWDQYDKWNGTSLASPLVTGAIALVIEAHPEWSSRMVIEAIRQTAHQSFKPDFTYGYGIVDAVRAIDYPSLTGKIINDTKGRIIPDITIQLTNVNNQFNTTSDIFGQYRFKNLPTGTYKMTVSNGPESPIIIYNNIVVPPSLPMDIIYGDNQ